MNPEAEVTPRPSFTCLFISFACLVQRCCPAASVHFRGVCTSYTHTHTYDLIPPQEARALEVCHRDSSLKLMEGDRGRKNGRWREGGWFVWGWRVGRQTGASEDEGLEQRYYKRRNWQQKENDGGRWRIKKRKEERMEPRVSAHGSVIHMTFKQPRCHSACSSIPHRAHPFRFFQTFIHVLLKTATFFPPLGLARNFLPSPICKCHSLFCSFPLFLVFSHRPVLLHIVTDVLFSSFSCFRWPGCFFSPSGRPEM